MNSSENNFYKKPFSYIYVETEAFKYEYTKNIISKFKDARIIPVRHYKDVFNRKNQDAAAQRSSKQLILAAAKDNLIYRGAAVCQSFNNEHFYYASLVMNCIYDCEYCYLQGMYPSGNIVIFVNIEDYFKEIEAMLCKHSVYLCISFDSDLLALEHITGFIVKWIEFCKSHKSLTIEIRSKCADFSVIERLAEIPGNVIFAWTLTPEYVASYEHKTPSNDARLAAVQSAVFKGCNVRLCFDPILLIPSYETVYAEFFKHIFSTVAPDKIKDVSFGEFRVSCDCLKRMRKLRPKSVLLQYPYDCRNGIAKYDDDKSSDLLDFIKGQLIKYFPEDKIYCWNEA